MFCTLFRRLWGLLCFASSLALRGRGLQGAMGMDTAFLRPPLSASVFRVPPAVFFRFPACFLSCAQPSSFSRGVGPPRDGCFPPSGRAKGVVERRAAHPTRAARGAARPLTEGARLPALHRGSRRPPAGRRLSPRPRFREHGRVAAAPVQRAPRGAVVVPPGRGPGAARVRGARSPAPAGAASAPPVGRLRRTPPGERMPRPLA